MRQVVLSLGLGALFVCALSVSCNLSPNIDLPSTKGDDDGRQSEGPPGGDLGVDAEGAGGEGGSSPGGASTD